MLGDEVSIVVKQYNSFLVDSLYYGPPNMDNGGKMSPEVKSFLEERTLDFATFEQILAAGTRGLTPVVKRPFLPLPSQCYRGQIKQLKSSGRSGPGADIAVIEADLGESYPLKIEVDRKQFYIYGHSMAKADLRYVIESGEYQFSMIAIFFPIWFKIRSNVFFLHKFQRRCASSTSLAWHPPET